METGAKVNDLKMPTIHHDGRLEEDIRGRWCIIPQRKVTASSYFAYFMSRVCARCRFMIMSVKVKVTEVTLALRTKPPVFKAKFLHSRSVEFTIGTY